MKIRIVRLFGVALLVAYALFAALSYITFAQQPALSPTVRVLFQQRSPQAWTWELIEGDATLCESSALYGSQPEAFAGWTRVRTLLNAKADPVTEIQALPPQ